MKNSRMNKHLSNAQLVDLKDKILADVERIQTKFAAENPHLKMIETNSGRDEVDSANDDIIRHQELRFATRENLYLKKLRKTLIHMEAEDYGMCEDCVSAISFTRLIARPTSNLCITCKEESERDELQNFQGRQSKSLGQRVTLR